MTRIGRVSDTGRKLLGIIRAPFLLLVPACLAPAFAIAWHHEGALDVGASALVMMAALAAHIAVNALNEYQDFRSGLDFDTVRTPFSGGSGTLVADHRFAPMALYVALAALLVTSGIGAYFVVQLGSALIAPGLIGLAIIVAYTRWINRFPLLCLFAPGIGFGVLVINLTVLVLTGDMHNEALWSSLLVTLLVSNLLLVNQLPDVEADRRAGRRHLAIVWGEQWAARAVALLLAATYLGVIAGWWLEVLPQGALLALATAPLAVYVVCGVLRESRQLPNRFVRVMGCNVLVTLLTPVLLALGWLIPAG